MAGPSVVQSVLQAEVSFVPAGNLVPSSSAGAFYGLGASSNDADYLKHELARLVEQRAKIDVAAQEYPAQNMGADIMLDGLRSISPANRARMIKENRARRERIENQLWLDKGIAEIRKKLGVFGSLI